MSVLSVKNVKKSFGDLEVIKEDVYKRQLEPQLITHPQMMRVMKVMEASFESDRLNQVIPFKE